MSSIDCTKCGAAKDEQVARCPLCGQPLAPTMPTKRSRRTVILTLSAIAGGVVLLPCVGGVAPYLYKKLTSPSYILTYLGHAGMAQGAVWAPDGRRVASIGVNSTARVWEPFTGITLQTCQLEKDIEAAFPLQSIVWSLDGKQLVALVRLNEGVTAAGSVVETLHVQVWDAATGQRVRSFPVTQPVKPQAAGQLQSTTYLPALHVPYLAMGKLNETYGNKASSSQVIEIWDAPAGQKMRSLILKDTQPTSTVVWLPDGKSIASGLDVYDVETGRSITTYHLDQGSLDALAWSPNGKRIAVNSFREGHRLPFLDALFAVGSDTGGSETLFLLSASDGRQLAKYDEGRAGSGSTHLAWSPDGKHILAVNADVEVWKAG